VEVLDQKKQQKNHRSMKKEKHEEKHHRDREYGQQKDHRHEAV